MRMYVGNLSYQASEDELRQLFASYGEVKSAQIVQDRETGQSRGFGFVEMNESEDASTAMGQLNGSEFQGRRLVVNEARPRTEGGGRGGWGGGGGGGGGRNRW